MTFYSWITSNYKKQEGAKGDLARFLKSRKLRTNSRAYERNKAALMCGNPNERLIHIYDAAWNEYAALKACGKV